jgi:hypothetical protein
MPTNTPNYNLIKPIEGSEFVDIDQINSNMDTVDTNLKRVDTEAFKVGHMITSAYDGSAQAPGNIFNPRTSNFVSDGLRRYRITARFIGKCNAAGNSGTSFSIQRSLNGGADTLVGDVYQIIYPSGTLESAYFFEVVDEPPAGNVNYVLGMSGYGINGNQNGNRRVTVWDAGKI